MKVHLFTTEGLVGEFTFPVTPDLERRERTLRRGSGVSAIWVSLYKCLSLQCLLWHEPWGAANTDCCVLSVLSPPINRIKAAVMSFFHTPNSSPTLYLLYRPLVFDCFSRAKHKNKKHNYLRVPLPTHKSLHSPFILMESDHPTPPVKIW